jgi:hypothetical protein
MMGLDTLEHFRPSRMKYHRRAEQQRRAYRHGGLSRPNQQTTCWQEEEEIAMLLAGVASIRDYIKKIWKKGLAMLPSRARSSTLPHRQSSSTGFSHKQALWQP